MGVDMGLDISINVVVGFEVFFKEKEVYVTRYCENTGKPYHKKDIELLCSHALDSFESEDLNLVEVDSEYEDSERKSIFGKSIYESPSHRHCDIEEMILEIDPQKMISEIQSMKQRFPKEKIGVFIVPQFSY